MGCVSLKTCKLSWEWELLDVWEKHSLESHGILGRNFLEVQEQGKKGKNPFHLSSPPSKCLSGVLPIIPGAGSIPELLFQGILERDAWSPIPRIFGMLDAPGELSLS